MVSQAIGSFVFMCLMKWWLIHYNVVKDIDYIYVDEETMIEIENKSGDCRYMEDNYEQD